MDSLNFADENHASDAFGPVALAAFALNPSGAFLFRAQHEHLLRLLNGVTSAIERGLCTGDVTADGACALAARHYLTRSSILLVVHQSMEEGIIRRAMALEPRVRMIVEQFEREMAPMLAEFASFSRRYATPSSILRSPKEFTASFAALHAGFIERFRAEERELLSAFDRLVRVGAAGSNSFALTESGV